MPTIDDLPLLLRVSQQLEAMHRHQREVTEALLGFLARQEKREERSALQEDSVAETREQLERAIAEIGKQVGRVARVAAEALEAARIGAQTIEERLRLLEERVMVRRSPSRRGGEEEPDDDPNWPDRPRRRR